MNYCHPIITFISCTRYLFLSYFNVQSRVYLEVIPIWFVRIWTTGMKRQVRYMRNHDDKDENWFVVGSIL